MVAGRTGVVLQNRGAYFSLDPQHPNRLEPGKMPLHTLIASLAFRDDKLWSVLGCMGADGQPQIHLQAYVASGREVVGKRRSREAGGLPPSTAPLTIHGEQPSRQAPEPDSLGG